jgi:polyisoprenoid-binding protein YceI
MKNKLSIIYLILITTPLVFGCRESVKEEHKNNVSVNPESIGQKYSIDIKESVVAWKGFMLIGSNGHTGYVYISKGELMIENGQLMGGTAEVNMNTIVDDKYRSDNNLIQHLKDPDFFDVEKFPISTFAITKVESTNSENKKITANLTIKGITQPVTFPAKIAVKDGIVKMNGKLVIDRTQWNVRYNSGKFYNILADETISDDIEFNINIVAYESAFSLFKNPK